MPQAPTEISRANFLALVARSGLVDSAALGAALEDAPDSSRAKHLARHLIVKELLTRFQAQQLLAGRCTGFFLGQYRILDLLGQGGMGKVYLAEHTTMRRRVALKLLSADITRTERARQLFRQEVRAAAKLVHPNIATAFDANEVHGRAFLVLEYVAGPSLSHLVRNQGPLPVGVVCEFMRQAALGLQHAHEHGMVHRDIKPSNLLIQPAIGKDTLESGTLKIVDFGLALLADSNDDHLTSDRQIVLGTPDFLSPEQARDLHTVDIRADLYSLGCTFYYLLTGQPPYPGGTALEKIARHAEDEPEAVEQLRPVVPPGVAALVRKLMAKLPEERHQTPAEVADGLGEFSELLPIRWTVAPPSTKPAFPSTSGPSSSDPFDAGSSEPLGNPPSSSMSLADVASTLSAGNRPTHGPDLVGGGDPHLRTKLTLAILFGFLLGAALIVAATLMR